jgi:Heparinase II/III-like protein/Heparinase II/III N-terminus
MSNRIKFISLYYHTLRYLTFRQIYYQIVYRIKKSFSKQTPELLIDPPEVQSLTLIASIPARKSYLGNGVFLFLNKQKKFESEIDWNFSEFDKLWVYNLNYFDFLLQEGMIRNDLIKLIDSFCKEPQQRKEGNEPYPISLRGINWIKFFAYNGIKNSHYDSILYSHYCHLLKNLEYHLLGNHLLENGFSLLFGAYYFKSKKLYKKATRILRNELQEQILMDGAHFELSPMYHQILLFRLLDCINLIKNNPWVDDIIFVHFLESTAGKMLGWLKAVTFSNGDIPLVNDSTSGIAPGSMELINYGKRLGIDAQTTLLSDSGYRMIRKPDFELFFDIGNIGPDYIPGHAHSDTFNFILYVKDRPVIVDTGISTYSRNNQRIVERSTFSHNTVKVNGYEQSEMWASFRVGRRAKVISINENFSATSAIHNGYGFLGIKHQRTWQWSEGQFKIIDEILGKVTGSSNEAYFHFHPDVDVQINHKVVTVGPLTLHFFDSSSCSLDDYNFSGGFNSSQKAKKLIVTFAQKLETTIVINC